MHLIHVFEPSSISRMSIVEKYKDMGTMVMGKVISGECRKNQSLTIMPNKVRRFLLENISITRCVIVWTDINRRTQMVV